MTQELNYPTDSIGRQIKVGDTIVYPERHRSSLYVKHATVIGIAFEHSEPIGLMVMTQELGYGKNPKYRYYNTRIFCIDRVTVIPDVLLQEIPITNNK